MSRKPVTVMTLLVFMGLLGVASRVDRVKVSETIHIRADGSVDPPTANITSVDNVTYYFTDNNYDEIVIERNNIVIDGNRYALQGTGSGNGIDLSYRYDVTITNLKIRQFLFGICLYKSSNNTIVGNNITDNDWDGIHLSSSNNNIISGISVL